MNTLIINLTRFGDLLQMQPLILGLKAQGHTVGLVCLDNFAPATVLLSGVSYVAPLPGAALLRGIDSQWHTALTHIEELLDHIKNAFPVDMVINTTATLSARLLARRIAQDAVLTSPLAQDNEIPMLGFGVDEHGFGISGDMWATFLQGASAERLNCPFNIVDMFRSVAKVTDLPPLRGLQTPSQSLQKTAQQLLHEQMPPQCQGFVAFQLGASEARRQWPVEYFTHVGAKLWQERKLCPVLLGSPAEKHLGESYESLTHPTSAQELSLSHPAINVIGKTDIPHLAAVLKECQLLITNDTGTMHLAAGLDVPVLSIFLATAQAWDTGPYMLNACCLEPTLSCHPCAFSKPCVHMQEADSPQPCLYSISAHTVHSLAAHFLQHGSWPELQQNEARIWKSAEDCTGFATLHCLSGHENEERSQWLAMQRYFYRQILDDKVFTSDLPKGDVQLLSPHLRQHVLQSLGQCTQLLLLLQEHIHLLQRMPSKQSGGRIVQICNTIYGVLEKCPYLKAFSYLWLVLFQERGAQWESFAALIQTLRTHLLAWQDYLNGHE